MKRTINHLILIFGFAILFNACTDEYDDSFLKGEIEKIKTELANLKGQVTTMQTIVDALNSGKVITNVDKLEDNKGYKITFNDATSIEVLNGEKAPIIGVKEFEGVYYWTITTDGIADFLLDKDNNKFPVAGKDGKTPVVAIDSEGYWTIDGSRVKDANEKLVKAQGDSFFKEVIDGDESVKFILSDDSEIVIPKSDGTYLMFENPSAVFNPGQALRLRFKYANVKSIEVVSKPEGWRTNVHVPDKYVNVVAPQDAFGFGEIRLQGVDKNGLTFLAIVNISIAGKGYSDPLGVLVLNEGNMTTENGSLIYISPNGQAYDYIYKSANGTELGNVTQDLYIHDGKVYIISQNGRKAASGMVFDNDGMLVVANSETMKKEAAYNDELTTLSWPTHIAVLDAENIFIRDNNGVYVFNSISKELQLIGGSKGAAKNRMAVASNKVFAYAGKKLFVIEKGKSEVSNTIEMEAAINGVVRSKDGHLWVSSANKVSKINSSDYSLIQANAITLGKTSAYSTPAISAKGDTLYYNSSTKIYRHIFTTNESKEMVDVKTMVSNASMLYNGIGVHPITGEVYVNTIKGYGWDFMINNISVFDFDGPTPVLTNNYEDYTNFPAGVFFPANFLN